MVVITTDIVLSMKPTRKPRTESRLKFFPPVMRQAMVCYDCCGAMIGAVVSPFRNTQ